MADWTDNELPENIMKSLEVDDLAVNYDISAGTVYSKNSATAWVNFDGTTTPPTIKDSFNVTDVVNIATGKNRIYFESEMDNVDFCIASSRDAGGAGRTVYESTTVTRNTSYVEIWTATASALDDATKVQIQIFGGKN